MTIETLYTTLFGSLSNGFYILAISYMLGFGIWFIWNKFFMHKGR